VGSAPPASEVPEPRGTTGTPSAWQTFSTAATSSVVRAAPRPAAGSDRRSARRIHRRASRAGDLTIRVYRFSLGLGVIAILSGLWLFWWWGFPLWAWTKLAVVLALAAHYGWTGRLILRARRGIFEQSDLWLRIFNEISVLAAIGVLILVVFKPF
jgi:uncharacterized membrane protein